MEVRREWRSLALSINALRRTSIENTEGVTVVQCVQSTRSVGTWASRVETRCGNRKRRGEESPNQDEISVPVRTMTVDLTQ